VPTAVAISTRPHTIGVIWRSSRAACCVSDVNSRVI
jgi:hypothetical protein